MSNTDLFDQYLKKELSETARNDFNQRIKSNQEFAKEFAAHLEIKIATKVSRSVRESDALTEKRKRKSKFIIISIIILFIIAIGFALLWNMGEKTVPINDLFNEPIALVERSADSDLLLNIETSFKQKDFDQTIILINRALEGNPKNYELLLYKGICLRDSKDNPDFIAAISIFDEIISDSTLEEKAQWHKAVTLYKNNQMPATKRLLEKIVSEPNHKESDRASKLLDEISIPKD